jgi:hypothetical protein
VWQGSSTSPFERRKASELANAVKGDRQGRPKITVLDSQEDEPAFWDLLGGKGPVANAAAGGSDADDAKSAVEKSLWRLSDADGVLTLNEQARGVFKRDQLDSNDVFFVDLSHTVYVWIGCVELRPGVSLFIYFLFNLLISHPLYVYCSY